MLDSTILENGTFVFVGKVDAPDKYYITIDNVIGVFPIIIANEIFKLEIVTDSIETSKILGSDSNDIIKKYIENGQYLRDVQKKLGNKFRAFKQKADNKGLESVKFTYDSLVLESVKYDINFLKDNPNTALSALILERITMAKQIPEKETITLYNILSKEMQETRAAKYALEFIDKQGEK